ncbi:MAG: hemerythrin domain-containing protein [Pseudomonadota bacterium]
MQNAHAKAHPAADPIAVWHQDHQYFARLLRLLEEQIGVFHDGGDANYGLMRDVVFYLRHYSDQVHHPREDAAFAILAKRDPGRRMEISRLMQEHRVIAHTGEALLALLEKIVDGAFVPRAEVEAAAATYLVYYRNHLATEEVRILPRAGELLTAKDWEAVAAAAPDLRDPLFGDEPLERFRELRREITRESPRPQ